MTCNAWLSLPLPFHKPRFMFCPPALPIFLFTLSQVRRTGCSLVLCSPFSIFSLSVWLCSCLFVLQNSLCCMLLILLSVSLFHRSRLLLGGFQGGSVIKNLPASAGDIRDVSSISGSGRSLRGGTDYSLQYLWEIPWTEEPGGLQSKGHKKSDMTEQQHSTSRLLRSLLCNMCRYT